MSQPSKTNAVFTETTLKTAFSMWAEAGQRSEVQIEGQSMAPIIKAGDFLAIAHDQTGIAPGDVILFRQAGILVAHRVIRIDDGGSEARILAKGDANSHFDDLIGADQIVGKVEQVRSPGGLLNLTSRYWRFIGKVIAAATLPKSSWTRRDSAGGHPPPRHDFGLAMRIVRWASRNGRKNLLRVLLWCYILWAEAASRSERKE